MMTARVPNKINKSYYSSKRDLSFSLVVVQPLPMYDTQVLFGYFS